MKDSVIYVGIDVHKDTNSVCMYDRQDNAFFAEAKLDAGTDINSIKEMLGHSSLAATQVYTHTSVEKLKKSYINAHPRAKRGG